MLLPVTLAVCSSFAVHAQTLQQLWKNPTNEYRVKTWWFFGYEHTTDEGITADVEALGKAGFGLACLSFFRAKTSFVPLWWKKGKGPWCILTDRQTRWISFIWPA